MRRAYKKALSLTTSVVALTATGCIENLIDDPDETIDERVWVEERFIQVSSPEVDVLWVVDDTASMAEEQAALAKGFYDFVAALEGAGLAWQVGVVTTDMSGDGAGVLRGNPWILTPAVSDPATVFAEMVAVGTEGLGPEAGLAAALAALSEPLISDENLGFRRESAALHVVVVSDEDDFSSSLNSDEIGEDPAAQMIDFLETEAERSGQSAWLSAVVGDAQTGCSGAAGEATPGDTYISVAQATGGEVASICDGDLTQVVAQLGDLSVTWPVVFPLQAAPDSEPAVYVDGDRVYGWVLDAEPPQIVFDDPPTGGAEIVVGYWLGSEA